jgi:hypothetical protein
MAGGAGTDGAPGTVTVLDPVSTLLDGTGVVVGAGVVVVVVVVVVSLVLLLPPHAAASGLAMKMAVTAMRVERRMLRCVMGVSLPERRSA